jgi:peptide/nickel transport system substrate-binding protein
MDDGIYYDSIWGYEGNTYSPDFDLYLWDWDGYADPGDTLASFTSAQIENWNEPCWSNAEFDAVVAEANTTIDPEQRKELIWRAQEIFYEETPEIATDYPDKLEAINTSRWDGWTRMYDGTGAAFYTSYVRDSYLNLRPKAAAATEETGGAGGLTIAVIAAVALLAVVVVAWLAVRRRRSAAEEE